MPETIERDEVCATCGAVHTAEAVACAETLATASVAPDVASLAGESEPSRPGLVGRIVSCIIYLGVCVGCGYLSVPFFETGDWWFGLMGIGLSLIALIGVKESILPTEWTLE